MPAFSWTTDPKDAKKEQLVLRELVRLRTSLPRDLDVRRGLAIGSAYNENSQEAVAVGVLFDNAGFSIDNPKKAVINVTFPYVAGLLAFRVGPAICKVLDEVVDDVDWLLFDGQGIAHPRGCGLASHIGVLYDKPSVGMTRQRLFGKCLPPVPGRLNSTEVTDSRSGARIGYALSLGPHCNPCYLSPGHRVSVADALRLVSKIVSERGCFPAPLNRAHAMANRIAKAKFRSSRSSTRR